jgi:hypothetical protein
MDLRVDPGFWLTLTTIEAMPPLRNRSMPMAVSSTSMYGWLRFAQRPITSSTGPINHCRISM